MHSLHFWSVSVYLWKTDHQKFVLQHQIILYPLHIAIGLKRNTPCEAKYCVHLRMLLEPRLLHYLEFSLENSQRNFSQESSTKRGCFSSHRFYLLHTANHVRNDALATRYQTAAHFQ